MKKHIVFCIAALYALSIATHNVHGAAQQPAIQQKSRVTQARQHIEDIMALIEKRNAREEAMRRKEASQQNIRDSRATQTGEEDVEERKYNVEEQQTQRAREADSARINPRSPIKLINPWVRYEKLAEYIENVERDEIDAIPAIGRIIKQYNLDLRVKIPSLHGASLADKIIKRMEAEPYKAIAMKWDRLLAEESNASREQESLNPYEYAAPIHFGSGTGISRIDQANMLIRHFFTILEKCQHVAIRRNMRKIMEEEEKILNGALGTHDMLLLLEWLSVANFERALVVAEFAYGGSFEWMRWLGGDDFAYETKGNVKGFEDPQYQGTLKRLVELAQAKFLDDPINEQALEKLVDEYTEKCKAKIKEEQELEAQPGGSAVY